MVNSESKQLVAQLTARIPPDTKAPTLLLQLPLGISLAEPVSLKIDNGNLERQPVQTCTNAGCIVSLPLKDPFLASLRSGTTLKITMQDPRQAADQHRRAADGLRPRLRQGDQVDGAFPKAVRPKPGRPKPVRHSLAALSPKAPVGYKAALDPSNLATMDGHIHGRLASTPLKDKRFLRKCPLGKRPVRDGEGSGTWQQPAPLSGS